MPVKDEVILLTTGLNKVLEFDEVLRPPISSAADRISSKPSAHNGQDFPCVGTLTQVMLASRQLAP